MAIGSTFSGCLAHTLVEMPPLFVQGLLLDSEGRPISSEMLTISSAAFYGTEETFSALRTGNLDLWHSAWKRLQADPIARTSFSW